MFNTKNIIIVFLIIIFFIAGMGSGLLIGKKMFVMKKDENDTYKAGWAAAKKRLVDTGAIPDYKNFAIKSLNGTVESISGNSIKIKIVPLEPLADPNLDKRTVNVLKSTEIYKIVKKSDAQFSKEMSELNPEIIKSRGPDSPDGYVNRFYSEKTDIGEIKVGSFLQVETGEDIKEKSDITAEKITITE